jgi:hypothetical protein
VTLRLRIASLALAGLALANLASAQTAGAVKVFLTCSRCDLAALKTSVPFAEFVSDEAASEVSLGILVDDAGPAQKWTLTIKGRGAFAGRDRVISFDEEAAAPAERVRATLARYVKLGIAEFAAGLPVGRQLDLGFRRPAETAAGSAARKDQKDPWNHWVFRLGASFDTGGEQSSSYSSHSFSGSANRVTDRWRLRVNGSRNVDKSSFDLDDETTIKSDTRNWNVDGLAVKSLGPRWSAMTSSTVSGSTFSNQKLYSRVSPGIEFDVFPYAESSRRSLTFSYTVGVAHYKYRNVTVFDKLSENVLQHGLNVSFGMRQPWGQVGAFSSFNQQLNHLDRNRFSVSGNANVRLVKSLTLNFNANYTRIRDQFTLEKGQASEEEVLLRLRQLATGYRYNFNIGFGYAFGALSNTTVNPRFGGG